jgi:peptide/nickel transport system substrate-binding protein
MKKTIFLSVLLTLTIALSACSGDKADDSSKSDESSITIGIPQDIEDSLDPHKAVAAGTEEILFNIFEGLVKPDSDGNLVPAVASDYKIEDEGKTYTFYLREGIKFHDGTPVTVEDIKYSIERCADTSGEGTLLVSAFSNIESVEIVDEKTVSIHLNNADTDFLSELTSAVIPAWNEDPAGNPIGTGPYRYVSRVVQDSMQLQKFEEYWGTPANITNVTLKVIADSDMIVTNLKSGAIDMFCRISTDQANELAGTDFDVYEGTMNLVQAMYLNNAFEPFSDVRVRQALCYAVDPQAILDLAFDGKGTIIGSSMFPAFGKYYMPELSGAYAHDVEKAKALLAEAGYADGFSFAITVPSNYQQHVDTAQVIVEQLKEINVDASINLVEWETWVNDAYVGRQFEATVVGVDASTLSARALLERFNSDNSKNFINFNSAAYDEAYGAALVSTDDAEQTGYYKTCEQILSDEAANVYIQDMASLVALNNRYGGYVFYPMYVQDFAKLYLK